MMPPLLMTLLENELEPFCPTRDRNALPLFEDWLFPAPRFPLNDPMRFFESARETEVVTTARANTRILQNLKRFIEVLPRVMFLFVRLNFSASDFTSERSSELLQRIFLVLFQVHSLMNSPEFSCPKIPTQSLTFEVAHLATRTDRNMREYRTSSQPEA